MVTIKIPALPRGFGSNLLGLAGLAAVIVAVGGLSGNWWWSLLAAGATAVGMAVLAQLNHSAVAQAVDAPTQPITRIGAA